MVNPAALGHRLSAFVRLAPAMGSADFSEVGSTTTSTVLSSPVRHRSVLPSEPPGPAGPY